MIEMPDSAATTSLTAFAANFDRASLQPDFHQAEAERLLIAERYPLSQLADLTLEAYATGDSENYDDTLSGLLTRGTPALGIIYGVGWKQVGIYKHNYGLFKSHLTTTGEAAQDWLRLRSALLECTQLAGNGKWFEIDKIPFARWTPAVRTKLLYVYWPTEVLPIYVSGQMAHYLKALGTGDKPRSGAWAATPNRQLLDHLRNIPTLKDWHPWELAQLLKAWAPSSDHAPDFYKVAPGENGKHWNHANSTGTIAIGWGKTGDLDQYKTQEELKQRFQEIGYYPGKAKASEKAGEVWKFGQIKIGDRIVANRGASHILGTGTVIEPGYEYTATPCEEDFNHTLHIDWDEDSGRDIPSQGYWPFVTVQKLSKTQMELISSTVL